MLKLGVSFFVSFFVMVLLGYEDVGASELGKDRGKEERSFGDLRKFRVESGGLGTVREKVSLADEGVSGSFKYVVNEEGYVSIDDYMGSDTDVVIPGYIKGREVRVIGEYSFTEKSLVSVDIPNTVRVIEERAFANNQLGEIDLPEKLEEIGKYAFWANELTELDMPDGVVKLGDRGFSVNKLERVSLSKNLEEIEAYAFAFNNLISLRITEGVIRIGDGAFRESKIEELDLPDSVKEIGVNAFLSNNLTKVSFGKGVEIIEAHSFQNNNLESADLPDLVEYIGINAFHGNSLTEVVLPDKVREVRNNAFANNEVGVVKVKGRDLIFREDVFEGNVVRSEDLTVIGYPGTVSEMYSDYYSYTFVDGTAELDFKPRGSDVWIKDLEVELDVKNRGGDVVGVWSSIREDKGDGSEVKIEGSRIGYAGTGDVYLHVTVENVLGGEDHFVSDVYKVDNTGPQILFDKLEGGYRKEHVVNIEVFDGESGVGEVYYLWSKEPYFPRREKMKKLGREGIASINEGSGEYYLYVFAEDRVGNINKFTGVFKLDNEAPEKPVVSVSDEWQVGEARVFIKEGEDNLSGVDYTEYKVGDSKWILYEEAFYVSKEGVVDVTARTVDKVGNVSEVSEVEVKVDNTAPKGYLLLANNKEYTVSVGVSGLEDEMSGLPDKPIKVQYGLVGESFKDYGGWVEDSLVDIVGLESSSKYVFRSLLRDRVGNVGTTGTELFLTSPGLVTPEEGLYYTEEAPTTLTFQFNKRLKKEDDVRIEVMRNGTLVAIVDEGTLFEDRRLESENSYTYTFTSISEGFDGERLESEPYLLENIKTGVLGLEVNLNEEYDKIMNKYRVYSTEFSESTGVSGDIVLDKGGDVLLSIEGYLREDMVLKPRLYREFGLSLDVPDSEGLGLVVETVGRLIDEKEVFDIDKSQKRISKRALKDNKELLDSVYRNK